MKFKLKTAPAATYRPTPPERDILTIATERALSRMFPKLRLHVNQTDGERITITAPVNDHATLLQSMAYHCDFDLPRKAFRGVDNGVWLVATYISGPMCTNEAMLYSMKGL